MSTDIRVGDLIRATSREGSEFVLQGRVRSVGDSAYSVSGRIVFFNLYDIEVLDRPEPEVEDDLLDKVIATYRKNRGFTWEPSDSDVRSYTESFTPVINAVREYDANRNKENAK